MKDVFDNFIGECFICNKQRKFKDLDVRSINLDEFCAFNMIYCNDVLSCIENAHQVTPQEVMDKGDNK